MSGNSRYPNKITDLLVPLLSNVWRICFLFTFLHFLCFISMCQFMQNKTQRKLKARKNLISLNCSQITVISLKQQCNKSGRCVTF